MSPKDSLPLPADRLRLQPDGRQHVLRQFLERQPPAVITLGSLLLVVGIAILDYVTGEDLSLVLLYVIPTGIAAWYGSRQAGFLVATLAGLSWVANELLALQHEHLAVLFWNSLMRIALFLIVAYLLSSLREQLLSVTLQASTDPLTRLFNRRFLYQRLQEEIQRARRYHHALTLICIDVDDFKQVNDRHGHAVGDAVLQGVGEILQGHTRQSDVPARIGGDEFAVLLIETAEDEGREVAEKLQHAMTEKMSEQSLTVTFSMGAATFTEPPNDVDEMFRQADEQLYQAKRKGKNRLSHAAWPAAARPVS